MYSRSQEFILLACLKPYTLEQQPSSPPPLHPLATALLVSLCRRWTLLDISCKWNHAVPVLYWLPSLSVTSVLQFHLSCHVLQDFWVFLVFFEAEYYFLVCVRYPFICWWTCRLFSGLSCCE